MTLTHLAVSVGDIPTMYPNTSAMRSTNDCPSSIAQ